MIELDSFINRLYKAKNDDEKIPEEEIRHNLLSGSVLYETLKQNLLQTALSQVHKNGFKVQIVSVQTALTAMLDKLYDTAVDTHNTAEDDCLRPECKCITDWYESAQKIFDFLEQYFPDYFNKDMIAPMFLQDKYNREISGVLSGFNGQLKSANAIELIVIALEPVNRYMKDKLRISFRKFDYYLLLIEEIKDFVLSNNFSEKLLAKKLYNLNFNDAAFFSYLIENIKSDIEETANQFTQLERLSWHLKTIKQSMLLNEIGLNRELPSIQNQLSIWLQEGIAYVQSKNSLVMPASQNGSGVKQEEKIQLSVSVSVLAVLVKLYVVSGIITNPNHSAIIRFFAQHYRTLKQEDISFDSLYNKYHQVNSSSKNIAKDLLNTLLNLIPKVD